MKIESFNSGKASVLLIKYAYAIAIQDPFQQNGIESLKINSKPCHTYKVMYCGGGCGDVGKRLDEETEKVP